MVIAEEKSYSWDKEDDICSMPYCENWQSQGKSAMFSEFHRKIKAFCVKCRLEIITGGIVLENINKLRKKLKAGFAGESRVADERIKRRKEYIERLKTGQKVLEKEEGEE